MDKKQEQVVELLQQFAAIPGRLARAADGKTSRQLEKRPAPDEWAAREILAHMRAVDALMTPRLYMILIRANTPLTAFDERSWADIADYVHRDVHQSIALLTLLRAEIVAVLQQLPASTWQHTGQNEVRGTQSLFDIVQDLVSHEEEHCSQFEALLIP